MHAVRDDAGARAGEGYPINLPVPEGSYDDAWVSLLEHMVIPAAEEFQPDLILVSAGCDAHRDDDQGGCELEASSFARWRDTFARSVSGPAHPWARLSEGGYVLDALGA